MFDESPTDLVRTFTPTALSIGQRKLAGLSLIVLALVMVWAGCGRESRPPAEEAVRALIDRAEGYAEDRNLESFRELISEDYADPRGNNRQSVLLLLNYYFSANRSIHLLTRTPQIHFADSSHAETLVFVAMAGRPIGGTDDLASLNADLYHVYATVVEDGGEWKIASARWARGWEAELDAPVPDRPLRRRR